MSAGTKWRTVLEKVAIVLIAVILFDCAAFGGGSLVEIFGLDFRMAVFLLFGVVSVPLMVLHFRELVKNRFLWAVLIWGVWFVIATVNGIRKGNNFDLIISSWTGFASFALLPGALCVLRDKKHILLLMKVAIAASILLAAETLFVLIAYQFLPLSTFDELNLFILYGELGGCTAVDDTIIRIFMRSHPLMIVSSAFCVYFATRREAKSGWFYCLTIALNLFSIMISYTRSVYFGLLAAVAAIVIYYTFFVQKGTRRKFYKVIAKSGALFVAMLLICDILLQGLFLSYGIYRTVGVDVSAKVYGVIDQIKEKKHLFARPEEPEVAEAPEVPEVLSDIEAPEVPEVFSDIEAPEIPEELEIAKEPVINDVLEITNPPETSDAFDSAGVPEDTKETEITNDLSVAEISEPTLTSANSEEQIKAEEQAAMLEAVNLRSDNIRKATQDELFEKIRQKPLLGHGVGAKLVVRPAGDNEYLFLDIAFKMGLIGLILYILPILLMAARCVKDVVSGKKEDVEVSVVWLIGLIGIVAFSWFNPYLGGTNGIVVYCLSICAVSLHKGARKGNVQLG